MLPKKRQRPAIDLDELAVRYRKKRSQGKAAAREMILTDGAMRLRAYPYVFDVHNRDDLVNDPDVRRVLSHATAFGISEDNLSLHAEVDPAQASLTLQLTLDFMHHKLFSAADRPAWFEVAEGLAWQLVATDTKAVLCDDLVLPFEAFVLSSPPGWLWLYSPTGIHHVDSLIVAKETKCSDAETFNSNERLVVMLVGGRGSKGDILDNQMLHFTNMLVPGVDLDTAYDLRGHYGIDDHGASTVPIGKVGDSEATFVNLRKAVLRYVMNVLLYMASPQASVTHVHADALAKYKANPPKRKVDIERQRELERERTFVVGTSVSVDPILRDAVLSGDTSRPITYRTLVRGHWRRQAHGFAWSQHRLIWIAPHVRGKDIADVVTAGHTYKVR